jgi:hypothetical protein
MRDGLGWPIGEGEAMNTKLTWVCVWVGVLAMCLGGCGKRKHVNYSTHDHGRYDSHHYVRYDRGPDVVVFQSERTVVSRPGVRVIRTGPGWGPGPMMVHPGHGPGHGKPPGPGMNRPGQGPGKPGSDRLGPGVNRPGPGKPGPGPVVGKTGDAPRRDDGRPMPPPPPPRRR